MPLYSLRTANRSVKLAAVLFLLVLGYSYVFAFLMVKEYTGITPARVSATYVPKPTIGEMQLTEKSQTTEIPMDLRQMQQMMGPMSQMQHTIDTNLLIQDSHIHIMIYALVAAFQALIVLGLQWPAGWRDSVITAAFGFGALDFAGQWLMKFGVGGFAWVTLASGWGMALVYLVVLYGTVRAIWFTGEPRSEV